MSLFSFFYQILKQMRNNNQASDIRVTLLCIMVVAAVTSAQNPAQPAQPAQPGQPGQPQPVPAQPGQPQANPGGVSETTQTTIKGLCQAATYKEACEEVLLKVANGSGTTEDVIKAGATVALQGITKVFNLTGTLDPKVSTTEKPEVSKMAVDDCKDLFENSIAKLEQAIDQLGNPDAYKQQSLSFTLRLWLSDVLTYSENCMDNLKNARATGFQDIMKDGMTNTTQITMSILDVFTTFSNALTSMGFNVDNIASALKNFGGGDKGAAGKGRRLLGGPTDMLGDDGVPRWLSEADRELLNLDGGEGRKLDGLIPNAVVALDGSGQFKKINDAINSYDPKKAKLPPGAKFIIYVKAGIYDEFIVIKSKQTDILMYGDGPLKTIITGKKNTAIMGITTSGTASFAVQAANFIARDMGFENTAGPEGHQAVALRANGEQQVFLNCEFNGFQDTLYTQGGSQFFRDCTIRGTVDFIFGNGASIFQHCNIFVRNPLPNQFNAVTASGRIGSNMPTGIVLQDCLIEADPLLDKANIKTYLGRPWKQYARTVFMECTMGDLIAPEGYTIMAPNEPNDKDSYWGEYANTGPGSKSDLRIKWPNVKPALSRDEAQMFTVGAFLPGADMWVRAAGAPYYPAFKP